MKIVLTILSVFLTVGVSIAQDHLPSDFLTGDIQLRIDPAEETVNGHVRYHFQTTAKTDSVVLDARKMSFSGIELNGKRVKTSYDGRTLVMRKKLRPNREYDLEISYSCKPSQAIYFLGWKDSIPGNEQIWTQGQGKNNSHWVPSFDTMSEKVIFSMEVEFDKHYQVVSNGELTGKREKDSTTTWRWEMNKPMSSYLLALAIGRYDSIRKFSASGVPIDQYFYPEDSLLTEPTYRFSSDIFNFLEKEIGLPYPWQNYKMVPVRDFLYAGMENTGATLFSDAYMIDSTAFADRNFLNVNAHELAHQWFGNLVTEKDASSHWLHEGFASYYAWLAEKEFLGDDHFFWMLYDKTETLSAMDREGRGESLLDPGASSLTFYEKGGLAILMLRHLLGESALRKGIAAFLNKYSFQSAAVSDFIEVLESSSGQDLSNFRSDWLQGTSFPDLEVMDYLRTSYPPMEAFMRLGRELTTSNAQDEGIITRYWDDTRSSQFRKRIILRYYRSLSSEFLKRAFETGDTQIRQALAMIPGAMTEELLPYYESLLKDKSYNTMEYALYRLWLNQPEKRGMYLDRTRGLLGFPDRNIRQLWLLLAILTKDYSSEEEKDSYRKELYGYTAPHFPMEVRQRAFGLIGQVFPYSKKNLLDLVNAAVHPAWQFREFARNTLREVKEDEANRRQLEEILDELGGDEFEYLKKVLDGK